MKQNKKNFNILKNPVLFVILLIITAAASNAQNLQWTQTYGGPGDDGSQSMVMINDGSIVIAGFRSAVAYGYKDVLLMKTDAAGNVLWSRTYNLNLNDIGRSVRQTSDGGFIIAGMTEVNPQTFDPFLIKTDNMGNLQWQRQYDYGFGDDDRAHTVWQTSDGGYIIAGQTWLMHGAFGNYDIYVVKIDMNGNVQWNKIFYRESEGGDVALGVQQLSGGGYIIGGFTQSSTWASYIIRTDASGNAIWSNIYPGSWQSECYSIQSTPDGGFIFTGTESSFETDTDLLIMKLDANGNMTWKKIYGTIEADDGRSLLQLPDGGYIVAGLSADANGYNMYVVRTNSTGDALWQTTVGGTGDDRAFAVTSPQAGTYYVSGWAWSYGQGLGDVYLAKLTENLTGTIGNNSVPNSMALLQNYPNPFNPNTFINYEISQASDVKLIVYDITGKAVRTLVDENQGTGSYRVNFSGSDLPSGVYFYTLFINSHKIDSKKMMLVK